MEENLKVAIAEYEKVKADLEALADVMSPNLWNFIDAMDKLCAPPENPNQLSFEF